MTAPTPLSRWKAIAAMAENRAIGMKGGIPWHLPEDFKWFKQCTLGQVIVLGRQTFEGLGRPLPGRTSWVLSRRTTGPHGAAFSTPAPPATVSPSATTGTIDPGVVEWLPSLDEVRVRTGDRDVFICGGANVYEQALPYCSELLLTRVKRTVEGDAFFPAFEHLFDFSGILRDTAEFRIERWTRKKP